MLAVKAYPMSLRGRRVFSVFSVLALALLALAPAAARAREEAVARAVVPKAVLDAVVRKYPGARLQTFAREEDNGEVLFEVEIAAAGGRKVSIDVSPAGAIMAEEESIRPAEIPAAVKAGLVASKYKGWHIVRCERVVEREDRANPTFELLLRSKRARVEVVFGNDGRIVREEPKSPGDRD